MDGSMGGGERRSRIRGLLDSMKEPRMADPKPHKASGPRRAGGVTVSGHGKLTVRGTINVIEKQVIVNHAPPKHRHADARTVAVAAILAHCACSAGGADDCREFVTRTFGHARLGDLSDADLTRVHQHVFAVRPASE